MRILISFLGFCLFLVPEPGQAADFVIANGLAPPNAANVISDATYSGHRVLARNVGCPPGWGGGAAATDPCPSPGAATTIELTGAGIAGSMEIRDSSGLLVTGGSMTFGHIRVYGQSQASITGGTQGQVTAYDDASLVLDGGFIDFNLSARGNAHSDVLSGFADTIDAYDTGSLSIEGGLNQFGALYNDATATMTGGGVGTFELWNNGHLDYSAGEILQLTLLNDTTATVTGGLIRDSINVAHTASLTLSGGEFDSTARMWARDTGVVSVVGKDFTLDTGSGPVAIPFGPITEETGDLAGTFASGEPFVIEIFQGGATYTGTIVLVDSDPPPSTVPSMSGAGLAIMTALLGVVGLRERARR